MIFTAAGTMVSHIGFGQTHLFHLEWGTILGVTGTAALVALLHSVLAERTPLPVSLETPVEDGDKR